MRRHIVHVALAAAGALAVAACGDEPMAASGRSMSAPAAPPSAASSRPNSPPRVTSLSIDPDDPRPGQVVQARVSVADADSDATTVRFTWRLNGELVASHGPTLALPGVAKDARIEVEAVANDGRVDSAPATAKARVGNSAPVITDVHFDRANELRAGDDVVAVVQADDPDHDRVELHYQWTVNGHVVDGQTGDRLATTELHRGDSVALRVIATDGEDESEGFDTQVLVLGNAAPTITSTPPPGMGEDGVYHYTVEASDPDRDRALRFSLADAPEGAKIDPITGDLTWKPTFKQAGTHPIEVVVNDGHGGEVKQHFEVVVKEVTDAKPAAAAPADQQPPASAAAE
jgi:hypothetical protein